MSKYKDLVDMLNGNTIDSPCDENSITDLRDRVHELENTIEHVKDQLEKYLDDDAVDEIFGIIGE